jgi:mxaA protein
VSSHCRSSRDRQRVARGLVALFALVVAANTRAADGGDESIAPASTTPVVTLRDSGYLLGDLLDERIDVRLPDGFRIDTDSLPLPGRVAPWLELRSARALPRPEHGMASIAVTYQIFAEVEQTSRVPIPAFKLRVRDGLQTRLVTVPEKSFLLSPALPSTLTDEDRELKPSPAPQPFSAAAIAAEFALAAVATLACAAYLLWAYDRLPFLPRSPGPFARLWRRWRRRKHRGLSDDERTVLLRDWHAALNQAAGETLYTSTLPHLFKTAPHLVPLRAPVEDLFARSWQHFYGSAAPAPKSDEVLQLLRAAAERERGVPC